MTITLNLADPTLKTAYAVLHRICQALVFEGRRDDAQALYAACPNPRELADVVGRLPADVEFTPTWEGAV